MANAKYNVGDVVLIKGDAAYCSDIWVEPMDIFAGKEMTIREVVVYDDDEVYYRMCEDTENWSWDDNMIQCVVRGERYVEDIEVEENDILNILRG